MDPTGEARRWVEASPYATALGVRVEAVGAERVALSLPYADANSNGDKALHGGVAASLAATAGQALARAALGSDTGPWHTAAIQVSYLSAALGESVEAEARLLRRGKELAYADVEVRSEAGRTVARSQLCVRGRLGAGPVGLPAATGGDDASDPGRMGAFIERVPFHARLGLSVRHMAGGRSRIVMPWREELAEAGGGVHEGALLALVDTTGAMACWAETGPGRFKASTPAIQARVLAPPGRGDLVARGRVRLRDRELLLAEVEVAHADDGRLVALGAVNYRIVTPESERKAE
jgi:uncharacterized protein (TIGR00369 family)